MKVFISADMEGASGIVCEEEVSLNHPEFNQAVKYLHHDLKYTIEGCNECGTKIILLNDSHDTMRNIQYSALEQNVVLIRGLGKPGYMLQGLDQSCNAAIFLGYHARAGALKASLCHTYSWVIHHVKINGCYYGEFGINAMLAGYYGVPVVLVSGDRAVAEEAKEVIPNISTVVVKEAISRHSAVCKPLAATGVMLKNGVQEALNNLSRYKPFVPEKHNVLEVEFKSVLSTEKVEKLDKVEVINGYTVRYETDDYLDLYLMLQNMITMSWSSRLK